MAALIPYFIAFAVSACLMAIEIVAGRVLAPYLGVSIYSWTSVIGSILLGVTLGNYAGGVFADKQPTKKFLGMNIIVAGFATLLIGFLAPIFGNLLTIWNVPLGAKTIFFCLIVFFPSAFLLAMVSPQLAKGHLRDLAATGRTVGGFGAWGAAGSIFGTLLFGFVLISLMGTRSLLSGVALFLVAMGAYIAWPIRSRRFSLAGMVSIPFFIGGFLIPGGCNMETNYYCIRITDKMSAFGKSYTLRLDHLVHSYVTPSSPDHLGYGYEQVYTNLVAMRHQATDSFSSFFVGGGGYAMPRYLEKYYPSSDIVVAEIDPGVTEANHRFMELANATRIQTQNGDARLSLAQMKDEKKFEFVFGDAFNDFSVPFHLTTVEFHRLLKSRMTPDGVYALNIIDDARYGHFLAAMVRTLRTVWTHVYVAPQNTEIAQGRNTIILMATDSAIDMAAWYAATPLVSAGTTVDEKIRAQAINIIPDEKVDAFLAGHPDPALTDDFVPTDRYLAPVFTDAY